MGEAGAQPVPRANEPLPSTADLDGVYVAVGPVASAVYSERDEVWDGGFGAELMLVRVRERRALAALGLAAGALRFVQAGNGRMWVDAVVGTEKLGGIALGASGGLAVEVGDLQLPRFGWQATLWAFAGVIPYVRIGSVEQSGMFVDAGVKISLPALRWR